MLCNGYILKSSAKLPSTNPSVYQVFLVCHFCFSKLTTSSFCFHFQSSRACVNIRQVHTNTSWKRKSSGCVTGQLAAPQRVHPSFIRNTNSNVHINAQHIRTAGLQSQAHTMVQWLLLLYVAVYKGSSQLCVTFYMPTTVFRLSQFIFLLANKQQERENLVIHTFAFP